MKLCQSCGRGPAVEIVIRRHVGMLVIQKFVKLRASLCRDCGRRITRHYTGRTLIQGWWGLISFFANWYCLASNVLALRQLGPLPTPMPPTRVDRAS